jgi:bleomycin hydrolase
MKRGTSNESSIDHESGQKRVRPDGPALNCFISPEFIDSCKNDFNSNQFNILARNAVTSVGAFNAAIDVNEENKINHVFLNTLKPWHLKATNQGHSGRCWMFAGLNIFRYLLTNALNVIDFEFSETYLFFWDKLERSNTLLQWYIDHPESTQYDRTAEYMGPAFLSDGGWWNYFANLVNKYGLIPKTAMNETYQSWMSDGMNEILCDRIMSCATQIRKLQRSKSTTNEQLIEIKNKTVQQIYDSLVKFMGQPPEKFDWSFHTHDQQSHTMSGLTPKSFTKLFIESVNTDDFVVLANIPNKDRPFYKMYEIKDCINVVGGKSCKILNLPINELKKYASRSIMKGIPVWFAGDVRRGFHPYKSALDEKLFDTDLLFGKPHPMTKEEKVLYRITEGNHAMTLVGVNFDAKQQPERWQVENSWGYFDYETPGEDGFLSMSNHWFENDLFQIVVHKNFLSRTIQNKLNEEPIQLEIWDSMAPALRVEPVGPPKKFNYNLINQMKHDRRTAFN